VTSGSTASPGPGAGGSNEAEGTKAEEGTEAEEEEEDGTEAEEAAGVSRFGWGFFLRNSSLLSAFLLRQDGLGFFFFRTSALAEVVLSLAEGVFSLVSREKEKLEPTVREMLKAVPWLASAWQKARH
jgi:hypothetical protein